jgi:hypothetical protein
LFCADVASLVVVAGGFWLCSCFLLQASTPAARIKLTTSADTRERMALPLIVMPDRNASSQLLQRTSDDAATLFVAGKSRRAR